MQCLQCQLSILTFSLSDRVARAIMKQLVAVHLIVCSATEVSTETNDSRSSGESVVKDEDLFASIPPEKAMQFAIILAEINRKCTSQHFNPT